MAATKWWDLGTAAILAAMLGLVWLGSDETLPFKGLATVALVAFALLYALWGRRFVGQHGSPATGYLVATIAVTAVAVYSEPNMLILQSVLFPLIWTLSARKAHAIAINVGAVILFTVAFALGVGGEPDAWVQGIFVESLSLVFSIALGLWIYSIAELGEQKAVLYEELKATQDRVAGLSREAGAAAERERIARDIHDTIAQSLTGIVLVAQRGRADAASSAVAAESTDPDGAASTFELIEVMAREALEEARALVATTATLPESDASLSQALTRLAERFTRETGIRVDVEYGAVPPLPRDLEVMFLRCAQEAVANVRKHSGAATVVVTLQLPEPGILELRVDDDGRGFGDHAGAPTGEDAGTAALHQLQHPHQLEQLRQLDELYERGFGLAGMRDRLALANGALELRTLRAPDGTALGASVRTTAPIPEEHL